MTMPAIEEERFPTTILGRNIGTATGWNPDELLEIELYDFEPAKGIDLPAADVLAINFEEGLAKIYDARGQVVESYDLVKALSDVPQAI